MSNPATPSTATLGAALDEEGKAALKAKYSRVYELEAPTGEYIYVRVPSLPEWKRFRSEVRQEGKEHIAGETLLQACLVHPSREEWGALYQARPGLQETFQMELVLIAGMSSEGKHTAL